MQLDGDDKVSRVTFVYPCGTVSVSSLGYFSSVGSSSKPSHPSLTHSISEQASSKGISIRRGRENSNSLSHISKRSSTRSG